MGKIKAWNFIWPISYGLIVLSWLPGYLAYYPAICAYDTEPQLRQIITNNYIEHHPIVHTLIIKFFLGFGRNVIGNATAGIGFYALVQLLCLAGVLSWGVYRINKKIEFPVVTAILQAICMFYPFHWYMSVTVTKDVLFTCFFVLFLISFQEFLLGGSNSGPAKDLRNREIRNNILLLVFGVAGLVVFRTNAKFAILALMVLLAISVIAYKKGRILYSKALLYTLIGFMLGSIVLIAASKLVNATQADRREMLSVPIQQLARVMVYHGGSGLIQEDDNTLTEGEKSLINDFLLDESWKEYDPHISDPVKRHTNTYVVRYRTKEFLQVYLGLLKRYPKDYIKAFFENNAGYFNVMDLSCRDIYHMGENSGYGYVQTAWSEKIMNENGIYKASKLPWLFEKLEKWAGENIYLKIPIINVLFVPGIWLWISVVSVAVTLIFRKSKMSSLLPFLFILSYFATLLLGPTVQMRYLYPIMTVFPFLIAYETADFRSSARKRKD